MGIIHRADSDEGPTKKELDRLARFLDSATGAMSLARVHGMMTAIGTAPGMVAPSSWIPRMTNGAEFTSAEQAQEILGIAMRLYNKTLQDLEANHATILGDRREWCVGYIAGVDLDPGWMGDEGSLQQIAPMMIVAENKAPKKIEDAKGFLKGCRENLEKFAQDIYNDLKGRRRVESAPVQSLPATVKGAPKPGRNDPCPCGSGIKFKRCCGFN